MAHELDVTGNVAGGGFIECRSGVMIDLRHPDPLLVRATDIAMSLANQCRFCGHCRNFYSVAEHCCHCHDLVERRFDLFEGAGLSQADMAFAVLMHDASEAYVIDLPRPVKPLVPGYVELEHKVQAMVRERFGFQDSEEIHKYVKLADNLVIKVEGYELMPSRGQNWGMDDWEKLDCIELQCWSPAQAASEFLMRLWRYTDVD